MFSFAERLGRMGGFGYGRGRHGHHHRGDGGFSALLRELDLTDDQIERIAELKAEGMSEGKQLMVQGGRYFKQLMAELLKDKIDYERVKEAHKAIQEHKNKLGNIMLEHAGSFAETLTSEQRKKVKNLVAKRFLGLDKNDDWHGPEYGGEHEPGPGGPSYFGPGGYGHRH